MNNNTTTTIWQGTSSAFFSCLRPTRHDANKVEEDKIPETNKSRSYDQTVADQTVATRSLSYDSSGMSYEEMPLKNSYNRYFPFSLLTYNTSSAVLDEEETFEYSYSGSYEEEDASGMTGLTDYDDDDRSKADTTAFSEDMSMFSRSPQNESETPSVSVCKPKAKRSLRDELIWHPNRAEKIEVVESSRQGCRALHQAMSNMHLTSHTY